MRVAFTVEAWEDYETWVDQRKVLQRINRMIDEARRDPGTGIGKPERLSGDLAGYWSRRIDQEPGSSTPSSRATSSSSRSATTTEALAAQRQTR